MRKTITALSLLTLLVSSCSKNDDGKSSPTPTPEPKPSASPAKVYENLVFNESKMYFSTDGSMSAAIDSDQAKTVVAKIDITYFYNYDYSEPGFFDPVARAKEWYWMDYYQPWLNTGVETQYYVTALTKVQFDSAKTDQSKIRTYLSDPSVVLGHNDIFPLGTCVGGRNSEDISEFKKGRVFGFKNVVSGKQGLILVRTDQNSLWPTFSGETKIDIVREQ